MAFKLAPKFLEKYENQQPNWGFGDLSYITFKRTYARIKEDGSQEEFFDVCKRVTEGTFRIQEDHCKRNKLPWNNAKAQKSAQEFFERMWQFKWSPPGRGFWIMGTPIVDKIGSSALNNCGFVSTESISTTGLGDPFAWAADMLMLGVGVGFDTKGAGKVQIRKPACNSTTFVIPDTREGWAESFKILLNSYHTGSDVIVFDYSEIRKRGTPIKGFGGLASGPDPLMEAHQCIRILLDALDGSTITSVAITDIMDFIGKCIVAGNIRRSALISLGQSDDRSFITMKDPDLHSTELYDRRWASNNTVYADDVSDFDTLANNIAKNGEPGLAFEHNMHHYGRFADGYLPESSDLYDEGCGVNPCSEQVLQDKELCCLVETYPANHDTPQDFSRTLKFAYLYAKTVTLLPTHDERTNAVMMKNRRIGCSMSGVQQAVKKFGLNNFLTKYCDAGYKEIRAWDRLYSHWLGVPRSIRMTSIKPSGSVSILAGATPGVHCTHSEYYLRTVRIAGNSPLLRPLLESGYRIEPSATDRPKLEQAVREAQYAPDEITTVSNDIESYKSFDPWVLNRFCELGGTCVAYFPVHEKYMTKSKFEITLWEQLALVREMQHYWSDNSVSCTITFNEAEKKDLTRAIEFYAPYLKTMSFLPLTKHGYKQAPYQEITKEQYDAYSRSLTQISLTGFAELSISGSKYCTNDTCEI